MFTEISEFFMCVAPQLSRIADHLINPIEEVLPWNLAAQSRHSRCVGQVFPAGTVAG